MIRVRSFGVAVLLALPAGQTVLAQQTDSVSKHRMVTWRDVAILEAFAIATVSAAPLDTRMAERLQNPNLQSNTLMRHTATVVETVTDPGAAIIGVGMYAYGRLAHNKRAADLGLHGTEALVIGSQLGYLLKGIVGRARPYMDITRPHDYKLFRGFSGGTKYSSFPSGHTIAAFSVAAAVTSETKLWWPKSVYFIGPILYGGAATVGWSRMFDNKHWASDVITGAAIGTFTGLKVVDWHHFHPNNKFDRFFLGPSITPAGDGRTLVRLHFAPPF